MSARVLITTLSPAQLFDASVSQARAASRAIERLASMPLAPGETCADRALATSQHALALSEAWDIIDALANTCSPPPAPTDGSGDVSRKGEAN